MMRLLKNKGNSYLKSYSVEKTILNINCSVLQELWILLVGCMTLLRVKWGIRWSIWVEMILTTLYIKWSGQCAAPSS